MTDPEIKKLINEDVKLDNDCNLCKESSFEVGKNTGYGVVIYSKDDWFATLSPKTGGNPEFDFTIQLMPLSHLTHFSQIDAHKGLSEGYGVAFSRLSKAMTTIMMQEQGLKAAADDKKFSVPIGTYGKSTTWNEKKEHLHIKLFPFRGDIGQPYTVDSSFGKKEVFKDDSGKEFVKMKPVRKEMINKGRFDKLADSLISLLRK
jgi:hypothetical protein